MGGNGLASRQNWCYIVTNIMHKDVNGMKERLTKKENVLIATMLFGLFFGAGNLIFPAYMGQLAGKNMWQAIVGFIITGVGLPLLGVAAMGISRSNGLLELSAKVSRPYR